MSGGIPTASPLISPLTLTARVKEKKEAYPMMKKRAHRNVCPALLLSVLALTLLVPFAALAEALPAPDSVSAIGYDWPGLAGVAGAAAFTLLAVQFIKAPLDKVWRIPTRVVVYVIAFAVLLLGQVFTVGFSLNTLALVAVNALVAASAAMGAYEMTFARRDHPQR